jgi:hypothetical protein
MLANAVDFSARLKLDFLGSFTVGYMRENRLEGSKGVRMDIIVRGE